MAGKNKENTLEGKIMEYRVLESRLNAVAKQREVIVSKMIEMQNTVSSIDEIAKGKGKTLFPIGSAAYVPGKVESKEKMIVEVGAGVALEMDMESTKKILNKRLKDLEMAMLNLQKETEKVSGEIEKLAPEIQRLSTQASAEKTGPSMQAG